MRTETTSLPFTLGKPPKIKPPAKPRAKPKKGGKKK